MRRTMGALAPLMFIAATSLSAQEARGAGMPAASPDTLPLTLEQAIARAQDTSEEIRLARSQTQIADQQIRTVRSTVFPQLDGTFGYTRTWESQFNSSGQQTQLPDSLRFEPNPNLPLADRVKYLEDHAATAGLGGLSNLFGDLPFGRENAYAITLTGRQEIFSPRLRSALKTASYYKEAADLQLREQTADLELAVRTAYYHALLAGELERISAAAVQQADQFLTQERLRGQSGSASELDVLRAEVASANLRPQLIAARNAASLALLDLRRLVNLPADQPVALTTPLEVPARLQVAREALAVEELDRRAAVAAAERNVLMRQLAVKMARATFLPSATLRVNYGRSLYPTEPFKWGGNSWATDFSATLTVDVPIFNGLRREAEVQQARIEVVQAQLQLAQLKEGVRLQYEQAAGERERAAAAIEARQQTVNQAQRVYDLTVLRYDRGLATQLEVSDARLALLQASTNLAQALSDFHIAEATVTRALGRRSGE